MWLFAVLILLIACSAGLDPEDEDLLSHGGDEIGQLRQAWGGVAADGWGLEDGNTDLIPASHDTFHWYPYHDANTDENWDVVSVAVASLDAEVTKLRMPLGDPDLSPYPLDEVLVSVSLKEEAGAIPPECTDTVAGTPCTLGVAQCLRKTTSGQYDLCHHYRVSLFWGRIVANTAARHPGTDPESVLYEVTRHEFTHVLGFRHGTGGPMVDGAASLSECQLETLDAYLSAPESSVWAYPEVCL